jgi:hypothetical protein
LEVVTDLFAETEATVVLEGLFVEHALEVREGPLLEDGDAVIERERAAVALELEQRDTLIDRKLERENVPAVDGVADTLAEPEIERERTGDDDADDDREGDDDELELRDVVGDTDTEGDCVGDNVSVEHEVRESDGDDELDDVDNTERDAVMVKDAYGVDETLKVAESDLFAVRDVTAVPDIEPVVDAETLTLRRGERDEEEDLVDVAQIEDTGELDEQGDALLLPRAEADDEKHIDVERVRVVSADTLGDFDFIAVILGEEEAERIEVRLSEGREDCEFDGDTDVDRLEDDDVLSETELDEDSRKVRTGERVERAVCESETDAIDVAEFSSVVKDDSDAVTDAIAEGEGEEEFADDTEGATDFVNGPLSVMVMDAEEERLGDSDGRADVLEEGVSEEEREVIGLRVCDADARDVRL